MASNYDFGVISTETGALGYYTAVESTLDADQVELRDQVGNVVETVVYNNKKVIDFTITFNKTKTAPVVGATITATSALLGTSQKFKVQPGVKLSEGNDKHNVLTLQAIQYVTNGYPSA